MDELEEIRARKLREMMRSNNSPEMIAHPVTVTDEQFDDFISKHSRVVVDCWAAWCGPCRMVAPVIEQLAKDYSGKIVFGKLNVDDNPETAAKFGIMSIPTLLVFKNGQEVDRIVGALPRSQIEARVKSLL